MAHARILRSAAVVAALLAGTLEARAQNQLSDGGFELGDVSACAQGLLPSPGWYQVPETAGINADTYTFDDGCDDDDLRGLAPTDYGNFSGLVAAQDGLRFAAGWSSVPESFGTTLSAPLEAGRHHCLSGWFTKSRTHSGNGGYDVYLNSSRTAGGTLLGTIGAGVAEDVWTQSRLDFVAPDDASAIELIFTPVGTDSYVGLDALVLEATFQSYGDGLAGSGGFVPTISGSGCPSIGETVTIELGDALGGALTFLFLGSGRDSLPFAGGEILVAPPWILVPLVASGPAGVAGAGTVTVSGDLPDDVTLIGIPANLQFAVVDDGAVRRIALTGGLEFVIGA
jgi:hypothetical protein